MADVMRRLYVDRVQAEDHGDLRADLVALVRERVQLLFDGPGRMIEDLVRESGASRELAASCDRRPMLVGELSTRR